MYFCLIFDNYPIVYNKGGPAEIVRILKEGETFEDFESLVKILIRIMSESDNKKYKIKENPN